MDNEPPPAMPPPVPPPIPSAPGPAPQPPQKPIRITFIIGMLAIVIAIGGLVFFFYYAWTVTVSFVDEVRIELQHQKNREQNKDAHEKETALIRQKIADIRKNGTALSPCPLIYPLLDKKGRVSALGSFMSLRAMEQATYLPHAVYQLSSEPNNFSGFGLFDPPNLYQQNYVQQLPFYFDTKDLAEGTLIRSSKGYRIHLRFSGTRPEKVYERTFKKKELYKGLGWMASCVHDWTGYHPNPQEQAFLKKPLFNTDDALERAASFESLYEQGGSLLATHWEKVDGHCSDLPCLREVSFDIQKARDGQDHLDDMLALLHKYPDATCGKSMVMAYYYHHSKYNEALDLAWDLLRRDSNNRDWNDWAAYILEYKGEWDCAIELLKGWSQAHPENPEVWIVLAKHMLGYSGGETWAKSNEPWVVKLYHERIQEGLGFAKKATEVAPGYAKAWAQLIAFGGPAKLDEKTVEGYFQKALSLDPNSYEAFDNDLNYLRSKPGYSWAIGYAFCKKIETKFPHFLSGICVESFMVPSVKGDSEVQSKRLETIRKKVLGSPYWKDYERSVQEYLTNRPEDMEEWDSYIQWADLAGRMDPLYAFAKKLSVRDTRLKTLYPYLLIAYPDAASRNYFTDKEKADFWSNPEIVRQKGIAYRQLAVLDPYNWHNLNSLAKYDIETRQISEAKKIFKRIGDHWAPEVWSREEFETSLDSIRTKRRAQR